MAVWHVLCVFIVFGADGAFASFELNFWKAAGPARKSLHFCHGTSGSTDSGSSAGEKAEDQTWGVGLHE